MPLATVKIESEKPMLEVAAVSAEDVTPKKPCWSPKNFFFGLLQRSND